MDNGLTRNDLMEALARIEAGLADASYRIGKLRQTDRTSRDLGAVAIDIEGARSDVVAIMQLLQGWGDDRKLPEA